MAKEKARKKDVAKVPKGSKAALKRAMPQLSSWEKEYGDKVIATQTRRSASPYSTPQAGRQ